MDKAAAGPAALIDSTADAISGAESGAPSRRLASTEGRLFNLAGRFAACEQDQVTIVVVTHDLAVANQAKRLVLLKDGKVVADEPVVSVAVAKSSP